MLKYILNYIFKEYILEIQIQNLEIYFKVYNPKVSN